MHMINSDNSPPIQFHSVATFASEITDEEVSTEDISSITYEDVLRTDSAKLADEHLRLVRDWLTTL